MSRRLRIATLATGIAVSVTVATVGVANASPSTRSPRSMLLIQVTETSGLNAAGVPDHLGGTGTIRATLRPAGTPNATVAGSIELELIVTSVAYPSSILEVGEIQLGGGTLSIQGIQNEDSDDATLAVTGGTGRYVGAGGTVTVGTTPAGDSVLTVKPILR